MHVCIIMKTVLIGNEQLESENKNGWTVIREISTLGIAHPVKLILSLSQLCINIRGETTKWYQQWGEWFFLTMVLVTTECVIHCH